MSRLNQARNSNRAPRIASERGIAMLIVVTVLVTMVIVALPFAMSMRQGRERTEAVVARNRASYEAELLADLAKTWLKRSLPGNEDRRWQAGERLVDSDPATDSLEEITPDDRFRKAIGDEIINVWGKDPEKAARAKYLEQRGLGPLNDDRGSIWTLLIEDAQGRVNANGASPFLLGNLFGSALLAEDLDPGASEIAVENVTGSVGGLPGFDPNGGFIRIGNEVIEYGSFDGSSFRGCTNRAALRATPLKDNGESSAQEKGTPVIDYTAYKVATHIISAKPGELTNFRTLEGLREIAGWGEGGVLPADRLERLLPYLTVWSRRETGAWLAPQLVVNQLPENADTQAPDTVRVRDNVNPTGNTLYFNPGTIVRISDGLDRVYQTVARMGDATGRLRQRQVTLGGPVSATDETKEFEGGRTTIAAYAPHPININTASREVLYAVMANIHLWRAEGPKQIVTPGLAWDLAGKIVEQRKGEVVTDAGSNARSKGPFRTAEDFGRWLERLVRQNLVTRAQHAALYLNAINPHNSELKFGTTSWCYRTLDVYHIETRVAVNNRAGEQIAEAGLREVVEIGPDGPSTWSIDSQAQFEERLAMGSGAKWTTTFPYGVIYRNTATHHIEPGFRGPKQYINGVYPDAQRGEDLGDVRLQPARMILPGAQFVDHFDDSYYTDGWYTAFNGHYKQNVRGTLQRQKSTYVGPFQMSFWWRPYSRANWTAFDCGMDRFTNRFALFVTEGEQGQELVFRCSASTLEQHAAEVYVPLDRMNYEPGNWYHIEVSCRGEDPSTMKLLVDGVDLGVRRGMTWLTGDLNEDAEEMVVDASEQFPPRGSIRIGAEIIEYDEVADGALRGLIRGARGTIRGTFVAGTPVHLLGYAMPITVDIMTGGATLASELRKFNAVRVTSHEDEEPFLIDGQETPIILGGYGPDTDNVSVTAIPMWDQTEEDALGAFQDEGLALWGSRPPGNGDNGSGGAGGPWADSHFEGPGGRVDPGRPIPTPPTTDGGTDGGTDPPAGSQNPDIKFGGWEVVHYTRTGNQFTIQRYIETPWQGAPERYFQISRIVTGDYDYPCFLVPISVHADGTAGQDQYLDPTLAEDQEVLERYYPEEEHTAYALLGTETPEDAFEVIAYNSIDSTHPSGGIYFVRDWNLGRLTNHFFNVTVNVPGSSSPGNDDGGVDDGVDDGGVDDGADDGGVPDGGTDDGGTDDGGGDDGGTDDGGGDDGGTDDGGGDDGGVPPTPGGGVPPGLRDPTDPPEDDGSDDGVGGGDPVEPGGGGTEDPEEPGVGGSSDGGDVTLDPEEEEGVNNDDESDEDPQDGTPENDDESREESGARDTGDVPSPEEPTEDESGGGESEAPEQPGEAEDRIPNQPAEFDEDLEGRENVEDTSDVWFTMPTGPQTPRILGNMRGALNTFDRDHTGSGGSERNGKFIPCFRVYEGVNGYPIQRAGRNDRITISDAVPEATRRIEAGIRWGHATSGWCALEDDAPERFRAAESGARTRRTDTRGYPRILKFPCGELPDEMSDDIEFGRSLISDSETVTAFLDELHIWRHSHDQLLIVAPEEEEGVLPSAEDIPLAMSTFLGDFEEMDGFDSKCGVFMLEGEMIIYRGTRFDGNNRIVLERCLRGQFGTKIATHPFGAHGRFLADMPVSFLDGSIAKESAHIPMGRTKGWPREGLVRIVGQEGAELVHFTRRTEAALLMPEALDASSDTRGTGLFRGRFGTDPVSHDSGEAVIFQPHRFWDRFTPRARDDNQGFPGVFDHPETSYLELRRKIHGAFWRGFTWQENVLGSLRSEDGGEDGAVGEGSGQLDILVLARFNPNVPWDSEQVVDLRSMGEFSRGQQNFSARARDSLFVFDDPGDALIAEGVRGNALAVEADAAEFRIYFQYKPNCWVSNDEFPQGTSTRDDGRTLPVNWKMTPWLQALELTYFSRTRSRYRAPIR